MIELLIFIFQANHTNTNESSNLIMWLYAFKSVLFSSSLFTSHILLIKKVNFTIESHFQLLYFHYSTGQIFTRDEVDHSFSI